MKSYKLPDSPEATNLKEYLREKIKKCEHEEYVNGGSQTINMAEEIAYQKGRIYREILGLID